ncbi:hypothetical protein IEO21_02136 [Rhodonia placenta]|uniref:Uncharacterized protein n=1 Tax=Rhodonia placenta TaxID=104341 RepID=A0A8H7P841_9APHY|nr:hypothetical protein IEO21_02136 [Postia placenta]
MLLLTSICSESCEGRYRVSASGSSDVADAGLATSDATTRVAPFTNAGEDNRHTAHQGRYLPEDAPPDENARAVAKFCHRIQVSRATNICRWRKCGLPLDDLSPAGITRHLRAHHFSESSDTLLEWEKRSRGSCEWSDDTHACGRTMSHAGLGKHIAAVHFRTTLRRCPRCGDKFAGLGTFNRHFRELCGSLGDQSA